MSWPTRPSAWSVSARRWSGRRGAVSQAVSGVDTPDRNAPYTLFCRSLVRHVLGQEGHRKIRELTREEFPQTFHAGWQELV